MMTSVMVDGIGLPVIGSGGGGRRGGPATDGESDCPNECDGEPLGTMLHE
jgi:hypothetical protein